MAGGSPDAACEQLEVAGLGGRRLCVSEELLAVFVATLCHDLRSSVKGFQ
jgi:hypothetical protein